ncbi:MAG TPA: hypothetical protein DCL61_05285, partial [Cyanobacteria bacterium UBA12227]|nr:hypothetical protein [Cyanobacteria bacterium UBA12227]
SSSSSSSSSSRSSSSSSSSSSSRSSSSSSSSSRPTSSSSSSSTKPTSGVNSTSPSHRSTTGTTGGRASGGTFQKPAASQKPVTSPSRVPAKTNTNSPQPTYSPTQPSSSVKPKPVTVPRHIDIDIEIENDDDDFNRNQTVPNPATAGSNSTIAPNQTAPNSAPASSTSNPTVPRDPNSSSSATSSNSANVFWTFLILLLLGTGLFFAVYFILKKLRSRNTTNELDNDIVTVSKLQVALFTNTPDLQSQLSELTTDIDTETSEGLLELLQQSALILLRNSGNWSHVLASSQSVNLDKAQSIFNQISVQDRSKYTTETLTNVKGSIKQKAAVIPGLEKDPGAYIVVTLLVGTADDQPLFKDVRSVESLKDALETVAAIRSDYLKTVELLWSPQMEGDRLTDDELLTNYTDMIQIY